MHLFEILYMTSTAVALIACIPQMRQLIATKCSDEFSLTTWTMWIFTQGISLMYVLSLKQMLLVLASGLWTMFYIIMVSLILYYRRSVTTTLATEELVSE